MAEDEVEAIAGERGGGILGRDDRPMHLDVSGARHRFRDRRLRRVGGDDLAPGARELDGELGETAADVEDAPWRAGEVAGQDRFDQLEPKTSPRRLLVVAPGVHLFP